MTLSDLSYLLFGGALVSVGMMATALADRIRGARISRTVYRQPPRELPADPVAPSVKPSDLAGARVVRMGTPREVKPVPSYDIAMAKEVTATLVASGYPKKFAADAVAACAATGERDSVEAWTRAALRRCARGESS